MVQYAILAIPEAIESAVQRLRRHVLTFDYDTVGDSVRVDRSEVWFSYPEAGAADYQYRVVTRIRGSLVDVGLVVGEDYENVGFGYSCAFLVPDLLFECLSVRGTLGDAIKCYVNGKVLGEILPEIRCPSMRQFTVRGIIDRIRGFCNSEECWSISFPAIGRGTLSRVRRWFVCADCGQLSTDCFQCISIPFSKAASVAFQKRKRAEGVDCGRPTKDLWVFDSGLPGEVQTDLMALVVAARMHLDTADFAFQTTPG